MARTATTSRGELSWRKKLLFSCGAFVLFSVPFVAGGEIVLRFMAPKSDLVKLGIKLPSSPRLYGLKPNVRSIQTGVQVETNSLGFREKEYSVQKPAGVQRIVVLGDSYTFGVGVEFPETFSKRLETQLNGTGETYDVINFGVSGYNTVLELATFREVAAAFQPDLVIVAYVLNDAERQGKFDDERTDVRDIRSLLTFIHLDLKDKSMLYGYLSPKVGALFQLFGGRYAVGIINQIIHSYDESSLGWIESQRALLGIMTEARKINADVLVIVFPMMVDFGTYPLEPAHERIVQFCKDQGVEVLDLLPRFRHEEVSEYTVFLDGHPNSQAHKIFAEEIFHHMSANYLPLTNSPS